MASPTATLGTGKNPVSKPNCGNEASLCVRAVSISQLGSFAFSVGICLLWCFSTQLQFDIPIVEIIIRIVVLLGIFYYYLLTWEAEEELITTLRNLGSCAAWTEWFVRFLAFLVMLYVIYNMTNISTPNLHVQYRNILGGYALMCVLYLVWDLVLQISKPRNNSRTFSMGRYWAMDFLMLIIIACLIGAYWFKATSSGNYYLSEYAAFISGIVSVIFLFVFHKYGGTRLFCQLYIRLTDRRTVR